MLGTMGTPDPLPRLPISLLHATNFHCAVRRDVAFPVLEGLMQNRESKSGQKSTEGANDQPSTDTVTKAAAVLWTDPELPSPFLPGTPNYPSQFPCNVLYSDGNAGSRCPNRIR
ncbi:hypothetical protein TREES_T100001780 [Tupaia chinensis]|uniref:Uncharacterized protein n=1 Tax=Tupaia chinensis TaxID=246437 RepID=L9KPG1_TUPCH|nr:hypothetical protein TREES_T100001780 [Tupaia chinensis]